MCDSRDENCFCIELSIVILSTYTNEKISKHSFIHSLCTCTNEKNSKHTALINYTPGIYVEGYIVFAFPFVHSSVLMFVRMFVQSSLEFTTKLHESFSSEVYLTNYSSKSIHIWTMGTLEGLLPYHGFWPQGSSSSGARGQNLGHL